MTVQLQKLAEKIAKMDRESLIRLLRGFRCDFELDFTEDFLRITSIGRLRHIVMSASLHADDVCSLPFSEDAA